MPPEACLSAAAAMVANGVERCIRMNAAHAVNPPSAPPLRGSRRRPHGKASPAAPLTSQPPGGAAGDHFPGDALGRATLLGKLRRPRLRRRPRKRRRRATAEAEARPPRTNLRPVNRRKPGCERCRGAPSACAVPRWPQGLDPPPPRISVPASRDALWRPGARPRTDRFHGNRGQFGRSHALP